MTDRIYRPLVWTLCAAFSADCYFLIYLALRAA